MHHWTKPTWLIGSSWFWEALKSWDEESIVFAEVRNVGDYKNMSRQHLESIFLRPPAPSSWQKDSKTNVSSAMVTFINSVSSCEMMFIHMGTRIAGKDSIKINHQKKTILQQSNKGWYQRQWIKTYRKSRRIFQNTRSRRIPWSIWSELYADTRIYIWKLPKKMLSNLWP